MNAATTLAARVDQYLTERRRLGFELGLMGYALHSLVEHVRRSQHRGPLTLELMAQWAPQAKQGPGDRATWARRLEMLRPFTRWLRQFEPDTAVPEEPIFGAMPGRVAPHIYSDEEIAALAGCRRPHRAAVQPARRGHPHAVRAVGLHRHALVRGAGADRCRRGLEGGLLTVRRQQVRPLAPGAVCIRARWWRCGATVPSAIATYEHARDAAVHRLPRSSRLGQPFCDQQVERIFDQLRQPLGWASRGGHDMPRLHDLRHTFAVRRLLQWHEQGVDMHQRMLALSTYLGHVKVSDTYWYLSAVPELMESSWHALRAVRRCLAGNAGGRR